MPVTGTPVTPSSTTIDITTLARVKAKIGGQMPSDTSFDAAIALMIQDCALAFQKYMDRYLSLASRSQFFDVEEGQRYFHLKGFPVTSVTDVRNDWDRAFGTDTIVASTNYSLESQTGRVSVDRYSLVCGDQLVKITYVGGMAANTTDFMANYGDISEAADLQIAFWFQRSKTLGSEGGSSGQGGSGTLSSVELLPEVKARLEKYRQMGSRL